MASEQFLDIKCETHHTLHDSGEFYNLQNMKVECTQSSDPVIDITVDYAEQTEQTPYQSEASTDDSQKLNDPSYKNKIHFDACSIKMEDNYYDDFTVNHLNYKEDKHIKQVEVYIKEDDVTDLFSQTNESNIEQPKFESNKGNSGSNMSGEIICKLCVSKFATKRGLGGHMRKHSIKETLACNLCDFVCNQRSNYDRHIRSHKGEKPYKCNLCGGKYSRKENLVIHMRNHTGENPFSCKLCSYQCSRKTYMINHIRTHTREKPFVCDICECKFVQRGHLAEHMKIHTGEKPFACDLCEYRSSRKSALNDHKRIHLAEKPFACSLCDFKTSRNGSLRTHNMRKHSQKKPIPFSECEQKS